MRWVATKKFEDLLATNSHGIQRVAVVGGSLHDPEIAWLLSEKPEIEVTLFGVEMPDNVSRFYLDLNTPTETRMEFDLVHCAHVLEHVWNVQAAIDNLLRLTAPNGLIWVNCPASCRSHGSPAYFSAGYQPELIVNLLQGSRGEVISSGLIGSRRSYFYEHTLRRWPDRSEYNAPLLRTTSGRGGQLRSVLRWIKYFPGRAVAALMSGELTDTQDYATQSYVLFRRE